MAAFVERGCVALNQELQGTGISRESSPLAEERSVFGTLFKGPSKLAADIPLEALRQGNTLTDIYVEIFQESLYEVGRLWESNKITVARNTWQRPSCMVDTPTLSTRRALPDTARQRRDNRCSGRASPGGSKPRRRRPGGEWMDRAFPRHQYAARGHFAGCGGTSRRTAWHLDHHADQHPSGPRFDRKGKRTLWPRCSADPARWLGFPQFSQSCHGPFG